MPPRSSSHDSSSTLIGLFIILIMLVLDRPQEDKVQGGGIFLHQSMSQQRRFEKYMQLLRKSSKLGRTGV
jgi:hypothetical protein